MTSIFGHSVRSEVLALYLAEALVGFAVAFCLLAFVIDPADLGQAIAVAACIALCSGLLSGIGGLYQSRTLWQVGSLVPGTVAASLALPLLVGPLLGVVAPQAAGATWLSLAMVLPAFTLAVLSTRFGFLAALRRGLFRRRLVMLRDHEGAGAGGGRDAVDPFEVVLDVSAPSALSADWLRAKGVWAVVAANPAALPDVVHERCRTARVRVMSEADYRESRLGRVEVGALRDDWLAAARANDQGPIATILHRSLDIGAALGLLVFTLPLLVVTALAITLDSPGPVFYRQERVGRNGRVFTLFKFRSMVVDAERGGGPRWATQRDPRVTAIGRIIRMTRIDEIPQVLNVLRGDMAFVGPRPERPGFVDQLSKLIPRYGDRAVVKPGITGWAQVNYPYGASVEDAQMKLAYDLYYIRRRSLFLDLLILLATVRVVLFREGAR